MATLGGFEPSTSGFLQHIEIKYHRKPAPYPLDYRVIFIKVFTNA